MLPILVLVPLLWPVFYQEGSLLLALGPLRITDLSLARGVAVALRIVAMAFACFIPLFTSTQTELVQGLMRLGVPYRAGLLIGMALRYVGVFYGSFGVIIDAQAARGLDLAQGSLLQRLRSYLPVLVPMLISSLRTADRVAMALEARGYGRPAKAERLSAATVWRGSTGRLWALLCSAGGTHLCPLGPGLGTRPWQL